VQPLSLKVDSKRLPVSTQGKYLQYTESVRNMIKGSKNLQAFPNHMIDKETYENHRHMHTVDYLLFEAYEKLKFKCHMQDPADR